MAKAQISPVHVRLPPDDLEALRALAARQNSNVHAEVVRAVQTLLASEAGDPQTAALKAAILAMLNAADGGLGDVLDARFVLGQFKVALGVLCDELKVPEPTETTITQAAARKAVNDLKAGSYWSQLFKETK